MRTLSLEITEELAGRRVKSLLHRRLGLSEGFIARVKLRERGICLNGERCRTVDTVKAGDILSVEVGDLPSEGLPMAEVPLSIVYEDADCAVIDKAPGVTCHGSGKSSPSLAEALAWRWGGESAFHPVSRLDKGTSGLICVARSGYAHTLFRQQLHTEDYRREYLLVCSPPPPEARGKIELPIGRIEGSTKRRIDRSGQYALTEYELICTEGSRALVRAKLHTGRTHQIRLHFSAIGCPLVGDWLYGEASGEIDRPALHSAFLCMRQPVTGERIELVSPLPEDMAALGEGFRQAAENVFNKEYAGESMNRPYDGAPNYGAL